MNIEFLYAYFINRVSNYPRKLNKKHHTLEVGWVSSSWGNVTVFLYSSAAHEKELEGRVKKYTGNISFEK